MDQFTKVIMVKKPLADVFKMWEDIESYPTFMENIKSVKKTNGTTSHWIMKGPLNTTIEWDSKITKIDRNKQIGWSSIDGQIKNSGLVAFIEIGNDTTQITLTIKYDSGMLGEAAVKLFVNPEKQLEEDLRRFKEHAEGITAKL